VTDAAKGLGGRARAGVVAVGRHVITGAHHAVGAIAVVVDRGAARRRIDRVVHALHHALATSVGAAIGVDVITDRQAVREIGAREHTTRRKRIAAARQRHATLRVARAIYAAGTAVGVVDAVHPVSIDEALIDRAITIVIEAIAALGVGHARRQHAALALLLSAAARAVGRVQHAAALERRVRVTSAISV
jgi:nucleotidyltransferase/DNA polymerase involved in DNA repair